MHVFASVLLPFEKGGAGPALTALELVPTVSTEWLRSSLLKGPTSDRSAWGRYMQALNLGSELWVPGCLTRTGILVPPVPQQLRGGALKLLPQPFHPITLHGFFFFFTASFLIGSCAAGVQVLHLCAVEWKMLPHPLGSIWGIVLLFSCLSRV